MNHDSADGWIIENNVIEENRGAAMMAGAHQQVRGNCLRNNGQYAMNAYKPADDIVGLVVENNEIVGNNSDDTEAKNPDCGCSGGIKFWAVNGADIRNNWIHDNRGVGLWADTNNNDFLIENNVIENNDGEALFYEISYNMIFRGNVVRNNTIVKGKGFAEGRDNFPVGTVYLSEAGGEPRVKARTDKIEIYDNLFENNWGGVVAWENSDRFCNSIANTSTGYCTLVVKDPKKCSPPGISREPLYSDCRWKTQRVEVRNNRFIDSTDVVGCEPGYSGRMAILANYGTSPDWSPYMDDVVQKAITYRQDVRWRDNTYVGPWSFTLNNVDVVVDVTQWQAEPSQQDVGSTFDPVRLVRHAEQPDPLIRFA